MKRILIFIIMLFVQQAAYSQDLEMLKFLSTLETESKFETKSEIEQRQIKERNEKEAKFQSQTYGHIVRKAKEEKGYKVLYFYDGVAPAGKDGKWGFINTDMELVTPMKYDDIGYFSNKDHIALVVLNGKGGFIDRQGREVIPIKYDKFTHFTDGVSIVELNNKNGLIRTNGELLTPIKYDLIVPIDDGLRLVELYGKQGVVNSEGKEVIPVKYDRIFRFHTGKTTVALNGRYGVFNMDGVEILPVQYDAVVLDTDGFYSLLKGELTYHNNAGSKISFDKTEAIKIIGNHSLAYIKSDDKNTTKQGSAMAVFAALAGDDQGMYALSLIFNSIEKYTESLEWAQKSAEKGNVDAMFFLAGKYADGTGFEKNYEKVAQYLDLILEQKPDKRLILRAYSIFSMIYTEGGYGLAKDEKKGASYAKLYSDLSDEK